MYLKVRAIYGARSADGGKGIRQMTAAKYVIKIMNHRVARNSGEKQ